MKALRIRSFGWRDALVYALTAWAALLSLESLVRVPGAVVGGPRLPAQLVREGVTLQRGAARDHVSALPEGIVLLEAADYDVAAPAQAARPRSGTVRLRLLALTSSGTGVHLPVELLGESLLGQGGRGRCVVLDASGAVVREMTTSAEWKVAAARSAPDGSGTLAWLAGLRPYRPNLCLWESLP
jgi:hypothetical protein